MMHPLKKQQGAVLFIALIIMLALTFIGISSMRGITLEGRMAGANAFLKQQEMIAGSALREAEFRLANTPKGGESLRNILETIDANCSKSNGISASKFQKICLQNLTDTEKESFFTAPFNSGFAAGTATDQAAAAATGLFWLPYLGTDSATSFNPSFGEYSIRGYWNMFLRPHGGSQSEGLYNIEYGAIGSGQGTFYHVITGQANDQIAAQSVFATIALGINN